MSRLELKVPPYVGALVVASLMWLVSTVTPSLDLRLAYRILVAVVLLGASAVLVGTTRVAFVRAGTTLNPTAPGRSSHLVCCGIFRLTRNPMYLGTLLALLALAALLSSAFSLILVAAFVVYIDRFQIAPEERVLSAHFGPAYQAYASRVRRWI